MRYETRIERIGENMGPIDWSYDFLQHFSNYCCDEARKKEMCDRAVELLRKAEDPHHEQVFSRLKAALEQEDAARCCCCGGVLVRAITEKEKRWPCARATTT